MRGLYDKFDRVDSSLNQWLMRHSIALLRISLGIVFLGLVPASVSIVLIASLECAIGLCFITGKFLRIAVWLLLFELIGILSPVVLLPGELFTGPFHAPNLLGQYVLKDVVLAGAGMVIAATLRGGRLITTQEVKRETLSMSRPQVREEVRP